MSTRSVVVAVPRFEKPITILNTRCSPPDEHPVLSNAHAASTAARLRALLCFRTVPINSCKDLWASGDLRVAARPQPQVQPRGRLASASQLLRIRRSSGIGAGQLRLPVTRLDPESAALTTSNT